MKNDSRMPRPRSRRKFGPEAGQGTLEYILILMVVVVLILGLLYQFSGAFKTYVASYFGNYVACLLEVGDLPGVATDCDEDMPTFDLKNGKPLITSIGNSGGGNASSASSSSSSSGSSSSPKSSTNSSSSSSSGSKGGSGSSESASTTGGSSRAGSSGSNGVGRRSSTPVGPASAGDARGTQDDVLGISPTSTNVGRYSGGDRSRMNNMSWGYYGEDEEQEREKDKPTVASMRSAVIENNKLRPKTVQESLTRKVASQSDEDNADYTFGGIFRILLIILMILAIVIFFGGQILQISKSGEK